MPLIPIFLFDEVDNDKVAFMEWCNVWEPGMPFSPGTLSVADRQQLLWGFPGILWDVILPGGSVMKFNRIGDLVGGGALIS